MIPYFEKQMSNFESCTQVVSSLVEKLDNIKKYLTYVFYFSLILQFYKFDYFLLIISMLIYIALLIIEGYNIVKANKYKEKILAIKNKYASLQSNNSDIKHNSIISDFKF